MKRIVCIGDSIRMGYQPTVIEELVGWGEIVAIGDQQGGHTRNVLAHLSEWAVQTKPDIVHVNAGLHDMARDPGPGPENRVSLEEYRENLRKIFAILRDETKALVLFALTTPVDLARQHAVDYGCNRTSEDVVAYNEAARAEAAEFGVPIVDLYQVVMDHDTGSMLGDDGVHFTAEASVILGKAVADFIRTQGEAA
jgi:lysophospholipase L1-like esterase